MTTGTDVLSSPEIQAALAQVLGSTEGAAGAVAGDLKAFLLRAQASKTQLDAAVLFDQADAVEQAASLNKVVVDTEDALRSAEEEASRIAEAVKPLVSAERAAADRYAEAAEFARQAREQADDLTREGASPATQTDAILKRNAAEQVAVDFRATAARTARERSEAEASLVTAREVVRRRKAAVKAARDAVANPPAVVPGWWTCRFDGLRRASAGQNLGSEGMAEVMQLVEVLAIALGVDRIFAARTRRAIDEEARRKVTGQYLQKQKALGQKQGVSGQASGSNEAGVILPWPGTPEVAPLSERL